jgi:hypothetical protein
MNTIQIQHFMFGFLDKAGRGELKPDDLAEAHSRIDEAAKIDADTKSETKRLARAAVAHERCSAACAGACEAGARAKRAGRFVERSHPEARP